MNLREKRQAGDAPYALSTLDVFGESDGRVQLRITEDGPRRSANGGSCLSIKLTPKQIELLINELHEAIA